MKKRILFYVLMVLSLFLVCCGTAKNSDMGPTGIDPAPSYYEPEVAPDSFYGKVSEGIFSETEPSYSDSDVIGDPSSGEEEIEVPAAGQLTASVVFDNDSYAFWKTLTSKGQEEGLFYNHLQKYPFNTSNRIKVVVKGVSGAKVVIDDKYSGVTDVNGVVYLFPNKLAEGEAHKVEITYVAGGKKQELSKTVLDGEDLIIEDALKGDELTDKIQLMLVIDATGSMGDEIRYLKSELQSVIDKVKRDLGNVQIELSIIAYRDHGDDYVTKAYDFTTDISSQQEQLNKVYAQGGGDWEEAVQEAFKEANKQSWDDNAKTKLILWVADAPCHDEDAKTVLEQTNKFAEKGIRVITVASSGIDKATEYLFRSICLITNGCYGYLTNDSGIGGEHVEATTEEKPTVEYLNKMLIRLIKGFYKGEFEDPVEWRGQDE